MNYNSSNFYLFLFLIFWFVFSCISQNYFSYSISRGMNGNCINGSYVAALSFSHYSFPSKWIFGDLVHGNVSIWVNIESASLCAGAMPESG